ncbi:nucleolar protein 9 [Periplaneta americana]|uniref:nucleolar protein 9 n=1 Tax=Periplaneta americana TaxID=6978 RepID=UPI0037E794A9
MESQQRGKKRKKRKSVLKNARKYGKQGKFGRGSFLNEDTYQYFVRVLELLQSNNFETEEEKVVFVNNVFDETIGEEVNYSCNQLASAALEKLLPFAKDVVLRRFMEAFGENLRPICCDAYGSHIVEKLIVLASEKGKHSEEKSAENFRCWVQKVGRFILNNLEDFVWDTYANHIIRTVTECLGGTAARNSKMQQQPGANPTPAEYTELLSQFVHRLSAWPQFQELAHSNLTSGLLQALLYASHSADSQLNEKLVSKLLAKCFVQDLSDNAAALRLVEAALVTASPATWTRIYEQCFRGQLATLAQHPMANFSVQKLLDSCTDKQLFEGLFDELEEHVGSVLAQRHSGVLLSLAQGCRRLGTRQSRFMQMLSGALQCSEASELVPLVARLLPCEEDGVLRVHLHGSLILQAMLHFNKPIRVVSSLLDMQPTRLQALFTDLAGCHITDAFMQSQHVGEKSRDRMIKKLQGMYVSLACSRHGSRSLDAIWEVANLKQKFLIMDELSKKENILNNDKYGSILSSKYCVSLYKHRKEEWKDLQGKETRKRKLFADIIGK